MSGKRFDRPRYTVMKEDVLREGDTLILFELDRLGRNKNDILSELNYYKDKGIRVMCLDIPTTTIDLTEFPDSFSRLLLDTINNVLIELVAMNAQAEVERKSKRSEEGREAMKARGEWERYGRPRVMSKADFLEHYARVQNGEIGSLALMRELGLNRDTYFRYVREVKGELG